MSNPTRSNPPNMELPADLHPEYANLVRISHSPAEIILDFACVLPGQVGNTQVLSRILMSPMGAKLLYRALGENLSRYEASFGEIPIPRDSTLANDLFRGLHPPESPPGS
jgi:hypothetical protein